jgi:hypothetical protein
MTLNVEGLVLESQYADYNYCIKGPLIIDYSDGYPKQHPKHIVLDFDSFLCEVDDVVARNELTDEDKEYMGRALEAALKNPLFKEMWIHQSPKPPMPWPSYDETPASQIPMVAKTIGLIAEALAYEQRGRDGGSRPTVVKKLQELQTEAPDVPSAPPEDSEDLDLAAV